MAQGSWTSPAKKQQLLDRFRRAEGQLRGVQRLIEEETDCERVAQQLAAVRAALDKGYFEVMACAIEEAVGDTEKAAAREELTQLMETLVKYA